MVQPWHNFVEYNYSVKNIDMVSFYLIGYSIDALVEHEMQLTILNDLFYFQMFHINLVKVNLFVSNVFLSYLLLRLFIY